MIGKLCVGHYNTRHFARIALWDRSDSILSVTVRDEGRQLKFANMLRSVASRLGTAVCNASRNTVLRRSGMSAAVCLCNKPNNHQNSFVFFGRAFDVRRAGGEMKVDAGRVQRDRRRDLSSTHFDSSLSYYTITISLFVNEKEY